MYKGVVQRAVVVLVVGLLALAGHAPLARAQAVRIGAGYVSSIGFNHLPSVLAFENLRDANTAVDVIFFAQPEQAIFALDNKEIDFVVGSFSTIVQAIDRGADLKVIAHAIRNEWIAVAPSHMKSCEDLADARVAVHSQTSTSTAMLLSWLQRECPGLDPTLLIIPGGEVRAAALLANRIDLTALQLQDELVLFQRAPGKFHELANFARDLPDLLVLVLATRGDLVREEPEVVRRVLHSLLSTHRLVRDEPGVLRQAAIDKLPDVDVSTLDDMIHLYLAAQIWHPNAPVTLESVAYSMDFYAATGQIQLRNHPDPGAVAAVDLLESVVEELGRQ